MSLPDRSRARARLMRGLAGAALMALAAAASACTVRPLYSDVASPSGGVAANAEGYRQIAIKPVNSRYAQVVRNQLIFMLNGGAGQPDAPLYSMQLSVSENITYTAVVPVGEVNERRPTAGSMTLTGSYTLTRVSDGAIVVTGQRSASAAFDQPTQEFAALRARRNAEDRAGRELAEFLRLDVGQRLATKK